MPGLPALADAVVRRDPTTHQRVRTALGRARRKLLALQRPDGHWVGELQGDTILESEYLLLLAFLDKLDDPRAERCARYLEREQQPGGGWGNYPGGPADVSVSVKAYFALKLMGRSSVDPHMRRAATVIRDLGGPVACNSFTRFYLALLGQIPYANVPAVPPELMLLPRWFPVNIYAMSSWTRTILVPLSLFYAFKPTGNVPAERGIAELFLAAPNTPQWPCPPTRRWLSWTNFFLGVDWAYKRLEASGWLAPLRRVAMKWAAQWMRDHFAESDGVGAIFPPMIYTAVCLRCLGVPDSDPEMQWALQQLADLAIDDRDGTTRLQPCVSPVWDTALALIGLADAGQSATSGEAKQAAAWLLEKEVRRPGDWSLMNPRLEPGGWFFEYRNGFYPDTDDTAMVLMALARHHADTSPAGRDACDRGVRWLMGMQNRDGGWAAFDRDIDREFLTHVPFADHNAMLDPSCPDITARVLEALGHFGHGLDTPHATRALAFLRRTQEPHGGWIGRWGVNYLYGTWQVLQGLAKIGMSPDDPMVVRAANWLKRVQQPGGGWGESCASYDDPRLAGVGTPTASQTAWALLGLIAAGEGSSPEAKAGIQWLLAHQDPDGGWREEPFTGTGFPKVFYLKYHLYALYFPLMALGRTVQGSVSQTN